MKLTYLPDVEPRPRKVAIGTFDGVHLGHREVIAGAETVVSVVARMVAMAVARSHSMNSAPMVAVAPQPLAA